MQGAKSSALQKFAEMQSKGASIQVIRAAAASSRIGAHLIFNNHLKDVECAASVGLRAKDALALQRYIHFHVLLETLVMAS